MIVDLEEKGVPDLCGPCSLPAFTLAGLTDAPAASGAIRRTGMLVDNEKAKNRENCSPVAGNRLLQGVPVRHV